MTLQTARPEGRGPPLGLITSPDVPSLIAKRDWRGIPILGGFLGLPNAVIGLGISAFVAMAGASVIMGDESGAAAAATEATAARAASEAAASKASEAAAHAKLQEDFEYRQTSQVVSEELANNLISGFSVDLTKKAMVKDFFNGVFLDVRKNSADLSKNSADLSNLNTRVEEIATRVTTSELVLVNNKLVKLAMTRAIQTLFCTGFVNWLLVDSWASRAWYTAMFELLSCSRVLAFSCHVIIQRPVAGDRTAVSARCPQFTPPTPPPPPPPPSPTPPPPPL